MTLTLTYDLDLQSYGAMAVTYSMQTLKVNGQSVPTMSGSKRTDRQTEAIALPPSVKMP